MRRSRGGSWAPCWTPCPPAATWSPRTRRRSSTRTTVRRPRGSTTSGGSRSSSGSRTSCPSWRSAAWTWSTRVWCRSRSGARRVTARARCQPRSPGTAGWRASPRIPGQWSHEWQPRDREPGLMRPGIDTTKPHTARIYDYYLGGKDNFAADRRTAEQAMESWPAVRTAVRENRAFLGRAVRFLVAEAGIRQFLDIGTGLPSANNVHEVAQGLVPSCRVVYVDNDPIVLAHARALLTSSAAGKTAYIHADLREPEKILGAPALAATLDMTKPVALMLVGILHFIPDELNPGRAVATLVDALPSGSYVAASHGSPEFNPQGAAAWTRTWRDSGVPFQLRTTDEVADLVFRGLDLVEPGLVVVSEWRPQSTDPRPLPAEVAVA